MDHERNALKKMKKKFSSRREFFRGVDDSIWLDSVEARVMDGQKLKYQVSVPIYLKGTRVR